jgi:tetratricopeptide (TPR) repeat protein
MRAAFGFVAANGATPTMRLVADINLESLSPTWHRMPGLLNQLRAEYDFDSVLLGGDGAHWLPVVLVVTNQRELRQALAERHVATDPLAVNSWIRKATSEFHSGDFAAARKTLAEARQIVGRLPIYDFVEYHVARREGNRDEAIGFLTALRALRENPGARTFLAAVRGDYETALRMADELEAAGRPPNLGQSWLVDTYYETGATERLQALVKRIDDSPQGTAVLMQLLATSGLVLDLADTPNFAAKLEQAGLDPATYMRPLPRLSVAQ